MNSNVIPSVTVMSIYVIFCDTHNINPYLKLYGAILEVVSKRHVTDSPVFVSDLVSVIGLRLCNTFFQVVYSHVCCFRYRFHVEGGVVCIQVCHASFDDITNTICLPSEDRIFPCFDIMVICITMGICYVLVFTQLFLEKEASSYVCGLLSLVQQVYRMG